MWLIGSVEEMDGRKLSTAEEISPEPIVHSLIQLLAEGFTLLCWCYNLLVNLQAISHLESPVSMADPKAFARSLCILTLCVLIYGSLVASSNGTYLISIGSYDITGPAADVNMMGYANMEQIASGIHLKLRARTFIVGEPNGKRLVFVNLDACMASQLVTIKVLERLKSRYLNSSPIYDK